MTPCKSYHILQ